MGRRRRARVVVGAVAAVMAVTLGLGALYHEAVLSDVVTRLALRDAHTMTCSSESEAESSMRTLGTRYGAFFRRGWLDRCHLVQEAPAGGLIPEAAPELLVLGAYFKANRERLQAPGTAFENSAFPEFRLWLDPLLLNPKVPLA